MPRTTRASSPQSSVRAEWYRSAGLDVSTETCPHDPCFTEEDMARAGSTLEINPPLRSRRDQVTLWDALRDGRVGVVAPDHVPWPLEEKTLPNVFDNHSGVPGVETLVPVVLSEGLARGSAVDRRPSLQRPEEVEVRTGTLLLPPERQLAAGIEAESREPQRRGDPGTHGGG